MAKKDINTSCFYCLHCNICKYYKVVVEVELNKVAKDADFFLWLANICRFFKPTEGG